MLWKCERCGDSVDELLQCECCRNMVCKRCYNSLSASCLDCLIDLIQGNRKCAICQLALPTNELKECSFCGRKVCGDHFDLSEGTCTDCFPDEFPWWADLEDGLSLEDSIFCCTRCGIELILDEPDKYRDIEGKIICPQCADKEDEERSSNRD